MDNYKSNRSGGNYNRRDSRDRGSRRATMFPAVCDNCGKDCEVPFKPSSGKPIYCSKCFEELAPRREDGRGSKDSRSPRRNNFSDRSPGKDYSSDISQLKDQLVGINKSLEKLVELFTPVKEEKTVKKVVKKKTESKKKATKSTKKAEKKK